MGNYTPLTNLLPHRIAGGVGIILIGAVVTSVTHRPARQIPHSAANVTPSAVSTSTSLERMPQNTSADSDSDVVIRSFSLTDKKLPDFRVTDLSVPLKANERFEVMALSQAGEVLGTISPIGEHNAVPGKKRSAPRTYADRWQEGKLRRFEVPSGAHRVVAGDINDRGDVAAISIQYRRGKPPYNRVLLYPTDTAYQDLGTIDPSYEDFDTKDPDKLRGVSDNLLSINNRGTILALVGLKSWFRRADGTITSLEQGIAFDMNNSDSAVGFVGDVPGGAVMWQKSTAHDVSAIDRIPLLPVQKSAPQNPQQSWRGSAQCVNDKGDAVITVPIVSFTGSRRPGRTAYYLLREGRLQLIAQMRGYQRTRVRINDLGDVIGMADSDQVQGTSTSILFSAEGLYDLTDAAESSGWKIVVAIDINNKRQILAFGTHKDRGNALIPILLTPKVRG